MAQGLGLGLEGRDLSCPLPQGGSKAAAFLCLFPAGSHFLPESSPKENTHLAPHWPPASTRRWAVFRVDCEDLLGTWRLLGGTVQSGPRAGARP